MPRSSRTLRVQPFGLSLGGLDAEAVDVELLGELALALQPADQLGHLGPDGHGLQRHHVDLAAVQRPVEVGQADAVVLGLAREDEPLELALAGRLGIPHDQLVAVAR